MIDPDLIFQCVLAGLAIGMVAFGAKLAITALTRREGVIICAKCYGRHGLKGKHERVRTK
jgi:hypothetical protein